MAKTVRNKPQPRAAALDAYAKWLARTDKEVEAVARRMSRYSKRRLARRIARLLKEEFPGIYFQTNGKSWTTDPGDFCAGFVEILSRAIKCERKGEPATIVMNIEPPSKTAQ